MRVLTQGSTPEISFLLVDSTNHIPGKTGLSPVVKIRKSGGSGAAVTNSVAAIDGTNHPGWYSVTLTASETDTLGDLIISATATGADPTDRLLCVESANLTVIDTGVDSLLTRLTATRAGFLDQLEHIHDDTNNAASDAATVKTAVQSATYGLSVIKTLLDAVAGFIDTEVSEIKAKTDNLPASPAAVGSNMGTVTSVTAGVTLAANQDVRNVSGTLPNVTLAAAQALYAPATAANLATIAGDVTTIKTATNRIPATPAQTGDAMTLTAPYDAAKSAADQTSVTAIKAKTDQLVFANSKVNANASVSLTAQDILDIANGVIAQLPGSGTGDTAVDHNTGGTDALRYEDSHGDGIDNGTISAVVHGSTVVLASVSTLGDGRWSVPLMLDSGVTYDLWFYKQGVFNITTVEITV